MHDGNKNNLTTFMLFIKYPILIFFHIWQTQDYIVHVIYDKNMKYDKNIENSGVFFHSEKIAIALLQSRRSS